MYPRIWSCLALLFGCLLSLPADADEPVNLESPVVWTWAGVHFINEYRGAYVGGEAALNGNLLSPGWIFRPDAYAGEYESSLFSKFPPQGIEVPLTGGALMLGYRMPAGEGWVTAFVGGAVENHDNPDPQATLRGTEWGVKGLVEYFGSVTPKIDVNAYGAYSTAFDTYQAFARAGYKIYDDKTRNEVIKFGPEIGSFGIKQEVYNDGRVGAFLGFENPYGQFILSSGYRHPFTDSPDGYYFNFHMGISFY